MLHFMLGTAGSGKTNTVRHRIAERVKNGESGIILLTPEQYTFESEKALLHLLGATAADKAEVLSFTRLVEYVGEGNSDFDGAYADTGIKCVVLKKALLSVKDSLVAFNKVKISPEFIMSLLEIITEFKQSNVFPENLDKAAYASKNSTFSNKMRDLSLIMSAYNAELADKYLDSDDDLTRLNNILNSNDYFVGKTVYIDAFDGFTVQQYAVLEHIIKDAGNIYVSFCTDGVFDKEMGTGIFSNVKKEISRFIRIAKSYGIDVASPEIFSGTPRFRNEGIANVEKLLRSSSEISEATDGVTVCEANTPYDEVDFTVRTIKKLVRENDYRYRDFTVIVRNMEDYRQIFDSAFNRYGVPCYLDKRADNSDLMLISYALGILKTAVSGFSVENVFSFLKSPLSVMSLDKVSELENYVFMWGVVSGGWDKEWKCNPDGIDSEFNAVKLEQINHLRKTVVDFLAPLKEAIATGETKKICGALYNLLVKAKTAEKLKEYAAELQSDGNLFLSELQYKSWDFFIDLLDKTVAVLGFYTTPKDLVETVEMLLKCDSLSTIPARIDEVMIGDAYRIRPCDPKVVFVLGANYREMPMPPANKGLLSHNDRAFLIESGLEVNDRVTTDSIKERYAAYSSVCSASERAYITYHRFDKSNQQSVRSDFVSDILKHMSGVEFINEEDCRNDRFESASSSFEFFAENFDKIQCDYSLIEDNFLKHSAEFIENARNGIPKSISESTALRLHGSDVTISSTRLESFNKCPFKYFCEYDIKAKPIERATITTVQRGTVAHYVLENLLKKYAARLVDVDDISLKLEITLAVKEYLDIHFAGFDIDDKQFVFTVERIKKLLFDVLRNIGEELNQTEFKPVMFEQKIANDAEIKPIKITTDGGSATVIGQVDRVDILEKNGKKYVRIIDYKTGKKLFDLSDILYGLNMQMLLYLFSIVESDESGRSQCAGILYLPVRRNNYENYDGKEDNVSYAMNGLVSIEDNIPEAMEPGAESRFVPYKLKTNGDYNSKSLVSNEDFKSIRNKVISVVKQSVERLNSGDIACSPIISGKKSVCEYCDYKSVCLRADENGRVIPKGIKAMEIIRAEAINSGDDEPAT